MGQACAALRVPFVDLTPLILREESAGRRLYWDFDNHMRPAGYSFVGRSLAERMTYD